MHAYTAFWFVQILECTNHLSTDPNCLENLQRADAIKHLIPDLELKEGNLVYQIHHEVTSFTCIYSICWLQLVVQYAI